MKIAGIAVVVLGLAFPAAAGDAPPSPFNSPVKDALAGAREATRQMPSAAGKAVGGSEDQTRVIDYMTILRVFESAHKAVAGDYAGTWRQVLAESSDLSYSYNESGWPLGSNLIMVIPNPDAGPQPQDTPFGCTKTPVLTAQVDGAILGDSDKYGEYKGTKDLPICFGDFVDMFLREKVRSRWVKGRLGTYDYVTCSLIDKDHLLCVVKCTNGGGDSEDSYHGFVRIPDKEGSEKSK